MASKEGGMLGDAKHNDVSAKTALRCRHKSVAYAVVDKERRLASGRRISVAGAPRILGHFFVPLALVIDAATTNTTQSVGAPESQRTNQATVRKGSYLPSQN